jgi:ABC-type transport system involved in multi-copper enzyme maturation permease subunit
MRPTPRVIRWLRALNPFTLAFNALFHAEVRSSGRKRGTYFLRFLAAGLVSGAMLLPAAGMAIGATESSGAERLQALQRIAPTVSGTIIWMTFIGLCLAAPVLTAPVVCDERRMRTLPALLTTPLTAGQIIVGKLAARLLHVIIMGLLPLPVLLAARAFGGVEAGVLAAAMGVVLATAVLAASLGVLASTWSRKASSASTLAVILLFAICVLPLLVLWTLMIRGVHISSGIVWLVASPIGVLGSFTARMAGQVGGTDPILIRGALLSIAINLSLAGIVAMLAAASLRRVLRAEAEGRTLAPPPRRRMRKGRKQTYALDAVVSAQDASSGGAGDGTGIAPRAGKRRRRAVRAGDGASSRVVGDHPVLWRELRPRARFFTAKRIVGAVLLAVLMSWITYEMWDQREALTTLISVVGMIIVCIIAGSTPAPSIAGEREGRTLDELLTTPLRPWSIILAKAAGVLRTQWMAPLILITYVAIVGVFAGSTHPVAILHLAMIVLIPIILLGGVGVLVSTSVRKASTAGAITTLVGVGLWAGLPMSVGILSAFFEAFVDTNEWFNGVMLINPVALAGTAVGSAGDDVMLQDLTYHMPSEAYTLTQFTTIIAADLAVASMIAALCLARAARILRPVSGRLAH